MVKRNGQNDLLHPTAYHAATGQIVVPSQQFQIVQDGNTVPYSRKEHRGGIFCADCQVAELVFRREHSAKGGKAIQNHFALKAGSAHPLYCQTGQLGLVYPDTPHSRDQNLAPYFYGNFDRDKKRAWISNGSILPDWIKVVQYEPHGFLNHDEIVTHEFVRRPRIKPTKTVNDLLKVITTLPMNVKEDTWVIINCGRVGVAQKLDEMIILESKENHELDISKAAMYRKVLKLPDDYPMTFDSQHHIFARQLYTATKGIQFPVLLHINLAQVKKNRGSILEAPFRISVNLGDYLLEDVNLTHHGNPITVHRTVEIKSLRNTGIFEEAFKHASYNAEFFALCHPIITTNPNGEIKQCFHVLDIVARTLKDVQGTMATNYAKQAAHEIVEAIPA